jgi:hypothetical protein
MLHPFSNRIRNQSSKAIPIYPSPTFLANTQFSIGIYEFQLKLKAHFPPAALQRAAPITAGKQSVPSPIFARWHTSCARTRFKRIEELVMSKLRKLSNENFTL